MSRVAFFDVDGTIVDGATGLLAADLFRQRGYISWWMTVEAAMYHVLHKAGWMDVQAVYAKGIAPFVGKRLDRVRADIADSYELAIRPKVFVEAVDLVREHPRCWPWCGGRARPGARADAGASGDLRHRTGLSRARGGPHPDRRGVASPGRDLDLGRDRSLHRPLRVRLAGCRCRCCRCSLRRLDS